MIKKVLVSISYHIFRYNTIISNKKILDQGKNNSNNFFIYFISTNFYYNIFIKLLKNFLFFFIIFNKTKYSIILSYYR